MRIRARSIIVVAGLTVLSLVIPATLPAGPKAYASETITATATVNVRSGPSTDHAIIGYVAWGWTIEATGPSQAGWTPVDYHGRDAYVASQYFTGSGRDIPTSAGATGEAWTTAALNVRVGPGTGYTRIDVLPYGAKVSLTGVVSGDFAEITWYGNQRAWVCQTYLTTGNTPTPAPSATPEPAPSAEPAPEATTPATTPTTAEPAPSEPTATPTPSQPDVTPPPAAPPAATPTPSQPDVTPPPAAPPAANPEPEKPATPEVIDHKRAGAALNLRAAASLDSAKITVIPNGSTLDIVGPLTNGRLPVLWQGTVGWVAAEYVTDLAAAGPPAASGVRYTTTYLNVRSGPGTGYARIAVLDSGAEVAITGQIQAGWYEILYGGAKRWVSGDYLTATKPRMVETGGSVGLNGLVPNLQELVLKSQQEFPEIKTYYGKAYRSGYGDHDRGYAVDIMLPNYQSNKALGDRIAAYFQAHAAEYDINYVIFYQRIWQRSISYKGWVLMEDRGSDNENHKNHVHISANRR